MAGEEEGWREAVLVAELSWREPGLLTRFRQVRLRGHEDAGDLAVHVVLLRRQGRGAGSNQPWGLRGRRPREPPPATL